MSYSEIIKQKTNYTSEDYTNIKNLWVKQNGRVIKNELRNLMDLSHVPIPDFSIFDEFGGILMDFDKISLIFDDFCDFGWIMDEF